MVIFMEKIICIKNPYINYSNKVNLNWCSSPINNNINLIKEFKFFKQGPFTR